MKKNVMRILIIFLIIVMIPFPAFAVNEDYIPIDIDGYYDDWEDKPVTEVYPGQNPPESKINYVSLFRDEDNVYVHVLFAYKNNQDITNMTIDLYTNMGDENYFLVPDFFWFPDETQSEPDMTLDQSTDLAPLELSPATEEKDGTTDTTEQETAPDETTEQDILAGHITQSYTLVADNDKKDPESNPAAVDPNTTTVTTTDEKTNNGQGNDSDNKNDTVTEPNTGDTTTGTTDEETDNGQGNGVETTETDTAGPETSTDSGIGTGTEPTGDNDLGDLLDILDPDNLVDLDNVLDRFTLDGASDSNAQNDSADLNSNLNLKKHGWYGTWGFTVWDGLFPVGSGYYTRSEGEPDELELYIPLSSIAHNYDAITEITMRIKKLGPQHIMCTGVSTGAYIGIAAGAGIALLSVGAYTFKRKRPFLLSKEK